MIFRETGCQIDERTLQNLLTGILYKYNYRLSGTSFRPGAKELLLALFLAEDDAFIITNSDTDAVVNKLRSLAKEMADESGPETAGAFLGWWTPRVFGNAKKYIARKDEKPGSSLDISIPGLDRKVHCIRPHYELVLEQLMFDLGISWDQLTVAGDIFELDGACPLAKGARFGLLRNPMTPDYEIDFLRQRQGALVLDYVDQILPFYRAGASAA